MNVGPCRASRQHQVADDLRPGGVRHQPMSAPRNVGTGRERRLWVSAAAHALRDHDQRLHSVGLRHSSPFAARCPGRCAVSALEKGTRMFASLGLPLLLCIFLVAAGAIWLAGVQLSNTTEVLSRRLGFGAALGGVTRLAPPACSRWRREAATQDETMPISKEQISPDGHHAVNVEAFESGGEAERMSTWPGATGGDDRHHRPAARRRRDEGPSRSRASTWHRPCWPRRSPG